MSDKDIVKEAREIAESIVAKWLEYASPADALEAIILNMQKHTATSMRSRCVEKVRERAAKRLQEAKDVEDSDYEYSRALECAGDQLEEAANTLESVSIQEQEK